MSKPKPVFFRFYSTDQKDIDAFVTLVQSRHEISMVAQRPADKTMNLFTELVPIEVNFYVADPGELHDDDVLLDAYRKIAAPGIVGTITKRKPGDMAWEV